MKTSGEIEIIEAKQWDMQSMGSSTGAAVCEAEFLPTVFRGEPEEPQITALKKNDKFKKSIKLYPHPANGILSIELPAYQGDYEIVIFSLADSVIGKEKIISSKGKIALDGLKRGTYIVHLEGKKFSDFYKTIIR